MNLFHLLTVTAALALPQTSAQSPAGVTLLPDQPLMGPPSHIIAGKLVDQAGGALEASSAPTLGMLYPLSDKLFVDPSFTAVGVGTTTPTATLEVFGTVAFGPSHYAGGLFSSVLGGSGNRIENGIVGSIGGGLQNTITAVTAGFIGGGSNNLVQAQQGVVAGGDGNQVLGSYGAIPGGRANTAGTYSFAAGRAADAAFQGCFVWADSSGISFPSTDEDQFLIRATGGVGIGTNAPVGALDVAGAIRSSGPSGGAVAFSNPLNSSASATLGWLNDVARIRIGGTGAGAQNGFDIQTTGNTSLLRLAGNGRVGVGTTTPSERLDVAGNVRCVSLIQTSDARLKRDVRELEDAMEVVRGLRGVSFAWDPEQMPEAGDGRQVGFLAQEVREVLPEAVHEDAEGSLAVAYSQVVPVLVEALQEQDRHMDELQHELAELRSLLATRP